MVKNTVGVAVKHGQWVKIMNHKSADAFAMCSHMSQKIYLSLFCIRLQCLRVLHAFVFMFTVVNIGVSLFQLLGFFSK